MLFYFWLRIVERIDNFKVSRLDDVKLCEKKSIHKCVHKEICIALSDPDNVLEKNRRWIKMTRK